MWKYLVGSGLVLAVGTLIGSPVAQTGGTLTFELGDPANPGVVDYEITEQQPSERVKRFAIQTSRGRLLGDVVYVSEKAVTTMSVDGSGESLVLTAGWESGVDWLQWEYNGLGALSFLFVNGELAPHGENLANCSSLGEGALYKALVEAEGMFRDSRKPAPDPIANVDFLIQAATTIPRLAEGCANSVQDPANAICGMAEFHEACVLCCENERTLAGPVCFARLFFGSGFLCRSMLERSTKKCKERCIDKPPAPGPGGDCSWLGCRGTCTASSCGAGEEATKGVCSTGLNCCVSCQCLYGDETCQGAGF